MADDDPRRGVNLPVMKATHIGAIFSVNGKIYGDASATLDDKGEFRSTAARLRFFFAEPQFRSKIRLDFKVVRMQGREVNPTGAHYHETQIEFPATGITNLRHSRIADNTPLPMVFEMPTFRTQADNPLRVIEFESEGFTVTRPDVPRLFQSEFEGPLRQLVHDLNDLRHNQQKISVKIICRLFPATLDDILSEMNKAIVRERTSNPNMNWIKDSAVKQLLLPGNIHPLETRPAATFSQYSRDSFFDAIDYKVTLTYNRVRQFEYGAGENAEYVNDKFEIKLVDIPSASAVVGLHDTTQSKMYLGLINFSNHLQTRPTEGQSFKIRLPMTVPPCDPYKEQWERENEGNDFIKTPFPEGDDEDEKSAQDVEKADDDLHWWTAFVVRSNTCTPRGHVSVMLHRPRDFRNEGPKADRPHIKTEVSAMTADFKDADQFLGALSSHESVTAKILPYYSDRVLKDEIRSLETILSGWRLQTQEPPSALQEHLGQFLWSVDLSLPFPELDLTEKLGGLTAIETFSKKVGLSAYQQDIVKKLTIFKHGLAILRGCFGSGKTEYGILIGCLLLASNTKNFHAQLQTSPVDSSSATPEETVTEPKPNPELEKVLWTTTTNIATDSVADRFVQVLEAAEVPAVIIRCHNLDGEKSQLINHYVPRPKFNPIPASEQQTSEFLARNILHIKAVKHWEARSKGDPRRRIVNLKLSDAMVRELDGNNENHDYKQLRLLMHSLQDNAEDPDVDRKELKRLVGVVQYNTLQKADAVFCTNAAAICPAMAVNFKPTFGINDETARAAEISTVAVFGSYPRIGSWLCIADPVQMHPHQAHVSKGKKLDDPFFRQGATSLPQRLESAGFVTVVLMKQFRCHGLLSKFSSDHYYHGMVEDGTADQTPEQLQFVHNFFQEEFGIDKNLVFINAEGARSSRGELGTSSCNGDYVDKIQMVLMKVLSALDEQKVDWAKNFSIGITSHYTAQVQLYRQLIDDIGDARLCAMPSDAIQGENKDLMIRHWCQSRITTHNGDVHCTLVTGTRARYGQIDIGSASTWDATNYKRLNSRGFEYDLSTKHAYAYYQFCEKHGAIFHSPVVQQQYDIAKRSVQPSLAVDACIILENHVQSA
ncbi:hypothetical protein BKA64DRAFT_778518 [Cadophora sp. MPI-SDFR-AT-0126]|nr:hypothetical protein BKA64DRAFT_778518 [Leotiomycetes sp. MPI-SDFR-AT-0126]